MLFAGEVHALPEPTASNLYEIHTPANYTLPCRNPTAYYMVVVGCSDLAKI